MSMEFFIDIKSFRSHYGPGVDSASNRNEYQEHFLRVKVAHRVRLTLPPSCAVVMKSRNLNFLEPPGPLQACNRTDLPFILLIIIKPFGFESCLWVQLSWLLVRFVQARPEYYENILTRMGQN